MSAPPSRARGWRRALALAGIALVAVVLAAAAYVYVWFQRDEPEVFADDREHYKYGSVGADAGSGVPYEIWKVLPEVFPEHLPPGQGKGYERMGLLYESPSSPRPIGTSIRNKPFPLLGLNCAVCHTAIVRDSPGGAPMVALGAPAQEFDIQAYFRFLFAVGADERFNADTLLPAIEKSNPNFSALDSLVYRMVVIPQTRDGLRQKAKALGALTTLPTFGPGRVDTFGPYKVHFGLDVLRGGVGTVDLPSIWNQRPREGMWLHWDGNNNAVEERNISAALGAGATEDSLDQESLVRIRNWIYDLKPPPYPAPIDKTKAAAGEKIYQAQCASCHAFDGAKVGQVTPIEEIGTDPGRLNSFTPELAVKINTFGEGRPWRFSHFRKTNGYANSPLDGIWLRAPYLHNGSVPTLRDLLRPPDQRPKVFYRGYAVLDPVNVGWVSQGSAAEQAGFKFDTTLEGNGNGGHTYGTQLSEEEINNLIEYMKTE